MHSGALPASSSAATFLTGQAAWLRVAGPRFALANRRSACRA
jgi:hypothetical protein